MMFRGFWEDRDRREVRDAELKCRIIKTREKHGELVIEITGGPDRTKSKEPAMNVRPMYLSHSLL